MSFADKRLFFLRPLMPRGTGCVGRLMPAGHLLFCATKKVSKKVAGNAIPRSRLPSDREIAHSRISSLYPCFDTNVRNRKYFLNLRFITIFSLSQAGATPGVGLQAVLAGSGHKINRTDKNKFPRQRAGRSLPQRRPGAARHSSRAVSTLFPAGCDPLQRNVHFNIAIYKNRMTPKADASAKNPRGR